MSVTDWAALLVRIKSRTSSSASGCWLWVGSLDNSGYARMRFRGPNVRVSRVVWCAFHRQEWPTDMHALHSCDVRHCVNPAHIRPGTNAENVQEAWDRGGLKHRRERTHCPHGHEYTPQNTARVGPTRTRVCRTCQRARATIQNAKVRSRKLRSVAS